MNEDLKLYIEYQEHKAKKQYHETMQHTLLYAIEEIQNEQKLKEIKEDS